MQKDRKSKLADAFMARRKKQLACYLASALGVAVTTPICSSSAMAFDVPPATQPKTVYMGSVGVGTGSVSTSPISHATTDNEQAGNSDALKRVGIRFVAPESQAKLNSTGKASQSIPQAPNVIQPPMTIASPGAISSAHGSSESSVGGIRIRIPSEKPSSTNAPALSANNPSSPLASSTGASSTVASAANLKMTVGTGVAPLPTIALPTIASTPTPPREASAAELKSAPSGFAIPSQSMPSFAPPSFAPPSFAAPASPTTPNSNTSNVVSNGAAKPSFTTPNESKSVEAKTNEAIASQPANTSKLQAKLQDNSSMTSRTPGIVRIPSMVVTGAGASTTELPPTTAAITPRTDIKTNETASLAAAKPLPTPGFIGNGSALELPMLNTAQTQMMQSRAPSIESRSLKQTSTHTDLSSAPSPAAIRSNSGFQSLPSTVPQPANISRVATAVNAESLAQSASRSIELAEKAIGPTPASSTPKLITAAARTTPRYEPSIIPVALSSSAPKANATGANATTEINNQFETTPGVADQANTQQPNADNQDLASMPSPLPGPFPGPVAGPATSTITVALKNVQTIRLPGKVSQVEIEDDNVCRVISTEPNTLTIIGASIGESKIKVWSTNPITKADDTQDFKISVRETWGQAAKNTVSIDDVNQSIAALFPGSSIVIRPNSDGSISVQGSAPSNESAKQILMLVRKMFLVPVQDRIAIASL